MAWLTLSLLAPLLFLWLYQQRSFRLAARNPQTNLQTTPSPMVLFSATQSAAPAEEAVDSEAIDPKQERAVARVLLKLGAELPTGSDVDMKIDKALNLVAEFLGAEKGFLFLNQGNAESLALKAATGGDQPPSDFPRDKGMLGWMMQYRRPLLIEDLSQDDRWPHSPKLEAARRSAVGAPLLINQESLGALLFTSPRPGAFTSSQLPVVTAAAGQLAHALYNKEMLDLIRDQATRQGGMIREKRIEASKSSAILESIAEGVLVTDENNEVVMLNAAAERILKLDRSGIAGGPVADFIGIYGEIGDRWQRAVNEWSTHPADYEKAVAPMEARLTLDDDRIISFSLAPVLFEGVFLGTVSTFRDITREVEVDRLKSEFVATVSHELRTPMTSVKGYVEMLLMEAVGEVNDQQRRFLTVIKNNIDRLGSLVNDLLDISRIEAGRVQLAVEPLDLVALLEETTEVFKRRTRLESKPMSIQFEVDQSLPPVMADRDRLRQIVGNLMENSFNYTPVDGHITLSAAKQENHILVQIADDGIGISPDDSERVFERFFRGEQALNMSVAGTGLGLSIVRQLVEMHGGSISLESSGNPGEGTTFKFSLPIADQATNKVEP